MLRQNGPGQRHRSWGPGITTSGLENEVAARVAGIHVAERTDYTLDAS
jgi:hypothetical protein